MYWCAIIIIKKIGVVLFKNFILKSLVKVRNYGGMGMVGKSSQI